MATNFNPFPKKPRNRKAVKICKLNFCVSSAFVGSDYCKRHTRKKKDGWDEREMFKLDNPKKRVPLKYKSIPELIAAAIRKFHPFIRERDRDGDYFTCISCSKTIKIGNGNYHAGHFYSGGKYKLLRFDEDNVHGQCRQCNNYGGQEVGHIYARNLTAKIGYTRIKALHTKAAENMKSNQKWTREELIEIIEKY